MQMLLIINSQRKNYKKSINMKIYYNKRNAMLDLEIYKGMAK